MKEDDGISLRSGSRRPFLFGNTLFESALLMRVLKQPNDRSVEEGVTVKQG